MMNITLLSIFRGSKKLFLMLLIFAVPAVASAASGKVPSIGPVRLEFIIFGLILLGVALFHKQTFWVAVIGLTILLTFKLIFDPGFHLLQHIFGETPIGEQLMDKGLRQGEWGIILNLLGLLRSYPKSLKNRVSRMYCQNFFPTTGKVRSFF
jgi:hypothetical protein